MYDDPRRIPLDKCKHGFLYLLNSRNLKYGVFNSETRGFTGIRTKFGSIFLFEEYHWDIGEPYGTANPLEEISDLNFVMDDRQNLQIELFKVEYLQQQNEIHKLSLELSTLKRSKSS